MLNSKIQDFLDDRKAKSLKKNITAGMDEHDVQCVHLEADKEFNISNWLPDAARRAGQISLSSHPCTFSHPSARKNNLRNACGRPQCSAKSYLRKRCLPFASC